MTADLLDQDAQDIEDIAACLLAPVIRTAAQRGPDDELPFCTAVRVDGADDPWEGCDDPVIQLDFFALGVAAASDAAKIGHRRMMKWAREQFTVTLPDGSLANPEYVDTLIKPQRIPYEHDVIVRYMGRYQIGLAYVAVT